MDTGITAGENAGRTRGGSLRWRGWIPFLLVILAAGAVRGLLLFGTPLVPGMNGGYYPVQARAVLERGLPGIPDLPLVFYVQAALAWALRHVFGMGLDRGVLVAVKLADSILPALAALPVALLVRRWGWPARAPAWIAPLAAAAVVLSAPILGMVGNFEKNSLGILWLCALLLFLHVWMARPTAGKAAGVLIFWGLASVTHIGVFGASLLFGGLAILFYAVRRRGSGWRTVVPLLATALAIGAIAAGVVLWRFDAQRIHRLAGALLHPADFISGNNIGTGGPGGGPPGHMPGGPPPFGFRAMQFVPSLAFAAASISALVACWRRKAAASTADLCVAGACAVGVLVLTGPWVQGDKVPRFNLIAIAPAVMAAAFALIHCRRPRLRAALVILGAACMIVPSAFVLRDSGRPVVSEEGLRELRSLAPLIASPGKSLVVARHGTEWWAAWALHTHIAHANALRTSDWQGFEAVYFLRTKGDARRGPPGGPAGFLFGGMPGPPPPGGHPPGGPGHNMNPMEDPEIPQGAEIVRDGEHFQLARIATPPEFVPADTKK